jgi:hypothetical protein
MNAIYRHDPVFIVGHGVRLFVYVRNLYFIRRQSPAVADGAVPPAELAAGAVASPAPSPPA